MIGTLVDPGTDEARDWLRRELATGGYTVERPLLERFRDWIFGLFPALKREKWLLTIAGSVVRYRKRVRVFDRVEMRSRGVGHDDRFIYIEQTMWKGASCTTQALIRAAVTSREGIVPPERVLAAMGADPASPPLPGWVAAWIAAETERPWPPER